MAVSATGLPSAATHYEVLGLTPTLVDSQHDPSKLIRRAYHRALLRNHPDKISQPRLAPEVSAYTVDQISTAFNVLSSPRQRAAYDTGLRVSRRPAVGGAAAATGSPLFQTGVENVDLDDLPYDEGDGSWYRSCRCGNDRGYQFREDDLEEAADEGELMVGCLDCSLWLRVHFAVMDDDEPPIEAEKAANNNQNLT